MIEEKYYNWSEESLEHLINQIKKEIDRTILQQLAEEENKFSLFLNQPEHAVTDQLILDWLKSLVGIT